MKEYLIYNYIDQYINTHLTTWEKCEEIINQKIEIFDKKGILNVWKELIDCEKIVVVEVSFIGFFYNEVFTKGVIFKNDTTKLVVDNNSMWDLGF